ncbi:MAG: hypothetical protein WDW36_008934 [Sanguina aurantia]
MATAAITGNSATSPNASGGRSSSSSCSITFPSVSASHFATSHRPAPLILPVFTPSPSPTPRGLPSRSPVFCLPKIADLASPSRAKPSPNAVSPGREADVTCHVRRANTQNATLDKDTTATTKGYHTYHASTLEALGLTARQLAAVMKDLPPCVRYQTREARKREIDTGGARITSELGLAAMLAQMRLEADPGPHPGQGTERTQPSALSGGRVLLSAPTRLGI